MTNIRYRSTHSTNPRSMRDSSKKERGSYKKVVFRRLDADKAKKAIEYAMEKRKKRHEKE